MEVEDQRRQVQELAAAKKQLQTEVSALKGSKGGMFLIASNKFIVFTFCFYL